MLAVSTIWNTARTGSLVAAMHEMRSLGFRELELAGEDRDLSLVPATVRELKQRIVLADGRLGRPARDDAARLEPGFASTIAADRERTVADLLAAAARAKRCGTNRVAIRCGVVPVAGAMERWDDWSRRCALGVVPDEVRAEAAGLLEERARIRDRHLEAACRTLHAISRADPDTQWCILPAARPHAIPQPDEIQHLLAELPARRPAYVHEPATAAVMAGLGIAGPDAGPEAADSSLAALRLSDAFGLETGLPPGAGAVDWRRVREGVVAGLPCIMRITRSCSPAEFLEGARFLADRGLG